MKTLGIKLNFETYLIEIENVKIPVYISNNGHYGIPLISWDLDGKYCNIILHVINISSLPRRYEMKKALNYTVNLLMHLMQQKIKNLLNVLTNVVIQNFTIKKGEMCETKLVFRLEPPLWSHHSVMALWKDSIKL